MTESVRLKRLLTESDLRADREAEALPLLSVSISWGVRRRTTSDMTVRAASNDLSNYKICRIGDLVINRMRAFQGALGIAPEDGVVSPDYAVLKVDPSVDRRWLNYFLTSESTVSTMTSLVRGIGGTDTGNVRTPRLNVSDLLSMTAPVVSVDEQRSIADYLDRETTRIDVLIQEQQTLVQMLRERRIATVAEALDGYETTRLRRLVDRERPVTYGILQCGEPVDGGVPYIGPSDITGEGLSPARDSLRTTAPEIASNYQRSVLAGGDVVISIGPAYGKVAVVSDELTGANLTQDTVRVALRPDLADSRFVVWALLSRQTAEYWDYEIMGATFRRLNLGTLARTPIPLPSIDEQRRVARYLNEQTARIDTLIEETERFISLARERRSALITASVTGQIDVREMA